VEEQIAFAKAHPVTGGPKRVLVIGSSTGYGLASRIAAAFGSGAYTVGVYFERESSGNRTATAGWYNDAAFRALAEKEGRVAVSLNGDAFSNEIKAEAIAAIKNSIPGGKVDLVVYSLAAPKRTDPVTGEVYSSVIKPLDGVYKSTTVDFHTGAVSEVEIAPATPEELAGTIKVMGGEDWLLWMNALKDAGVLADGAGTVAYSYIGPTLTHAVYTNGTIGAAKTDLEQKAREIDALLAPLGGKAFVSVNKALVTQASSAIPVVPLYMMLLFDIMKKRGAHEGCIEQMVRMFDRLYQGGWDAVPVDEAGRVRMDDWEMDAAVQAEVAALWPTVTSENVESVGDLAGYREDFYRLFGFGFDGVDYDADVKVN
jgi:enoyl-[acyl-carrier protein] reductase/trans-2-enoyl-CoA reductase (NAD+)